MISEHRTGDFHLTGLALSAHRNIQAPLFSPSPGWLRYSFLLLAHVAQVFIPISGSNIGSHMAQIFVDIHMEDNCKVNIRYMYLMNWKTPSYRTFGYFINEVLADSIEEIFLDVNQAIFKS